MAQRKFLQYVPFLTARGGGWRGCVFTTDLSPDEVIAEIQANQSRIKGMYAETTPIITSNITMPSAKEGGNEV